MYIKKISVVGFENQKDVIIGDLSQQMNYTVSGDAEMLCRGIEIMLSNTKMSGTSFKEGSFVEIVFDNSCQRLLRGEKGEVCLRKSCEGYFLDDGPIAEGEVVNLLGSAGLSSSRIVLHLQKEIASIVSLPDADRLGLLKEITGVCFVEESLAKSLCALEETDKDVKKLLEDDIELAEYEYLEKITGRNALWKQISEKQDQYNEIQKLSEQVRADELELLRVLSTLEELRQSEQFRILEQRARSVTQMIEGKGRAQEKCREQVKSLGKDIAEVDKILKQHVLVEKIQSRIQENKEQQEQERITQEAHGARVQEGWTNDNIGALEIELALKEKDLKRHESDKVDLDSKLVDLARHEKSHRNAKKKLKDEKEKLEAEIAKLEQETTNAKDRIYNGLAEETRDGLEAFERWHKANDCDGVIGPVYALVECDETYYTAVEATAGDSLYHVVVEQLDIAQKIIRHLKEESAGRLTFRFVEEVSATCDQPQPSEDNGTTPLLHLLTCGQRHKQALAKILGNTVYTENASTTHPDGLGQVTASGDRYNEGVMTGGFYDPDLSKLKFAKIIRDNDKSCSEKRKELQAKENELADIDTLCNKLDSIREKTRVEVGRKWEQIEECTRAIDEKKEKLKRLTKKGENESDKELQELRDQHASATAALAKINSSNETVDSLLDRKSKLQKDRDSLVSSDAKASEELAVLRDRLKDVRDTIADTERSLESETREREEYRRLTGRNRELADRIQECKGKLGSLGDETALIQRITVLRADLESRDRKIEEACLLEDWKKYKEMSGEVLGNIKGRLGPSVERKAQLDEFLGITAVIRKSISEMFLSKDECLVKYKDLPAAFEQVFSKLVPGCSGKLTLSGKERNPGDNTEVYDGVKMVVSSNRQEGTLSVAENTIAGLALVLAIHKCDFAPPFYLFDIFSSSAAKTQYFASWPKAKKVVPAGE